MLLQHHIAPELRIAAIEKQLSDLKADLDNIQLCRNEGPKDAACDFVLDYGSAVLTAGVTFLEHKLADHLNNNAKKAAE